MKKIMFNDTFRLTESVLAGKKTQTRRLVAKQQLRTILHVPEYADRSFDELVEGCTCNKAAGYSVNLFAPLKRGEEVAVAQSNKDLLDKEYLPTSIKNEIIALVGANSKGISNKEYA